MEKICTESENPYFSRPTTGQNVEMLVLQVIHIVINIINIAKQNVNKDIAQLCSPKTLKALCLRRL